MYWRSPRSYVSSGPSLFIHVGEMQQTAHGSINLARDESNRECNPGIRVSSDISGRTRSMLLMFVILQIIKSPRLDLASLSDQRRRREIM